MKKSFVVILFIFVCVFTGTTQQIQVISYNNHVGYSSSSIRSITQDSKGWMWFTTGNEVFKFDGFQFQKYPLCKDVKLNSVFNIFEINNKIWINATPYLLVVDGDSLKKMQIKNNFNRQKKEDDISAHLMHNDKHYFITNNGLYWLINNHLAPLIVIENLNPNGFDKLFSYNDSLLIAYIDHKKQLLVFNLNNKKHYEIKENVWGLEQYKGSLFTLSPEKGLTKIIKLFIHNKRVFINTSNIYNTQWRTQIKHFNIDYNGNFWIFDINENVIKISPNGNKRIISQKDGFRDLVYLTSFTDREGNFWISTVSDLLKIPETQFIRYTKSDHLLSNQVWDINKDVEGKYLFINTVEGINLFDIKNATIQTITKNKLPFKANIIKCNKNNLYYFDKNIFYKAVLNTKKLKLSQEVELARFPLNILSAAIDLRDRYYFSTYAGTFVWYNNKIKKLSKIPYKKLYVDLQNILWAGKFDKGLDVFTIIEHKFGAKLKLLIKIDSINRLIPRVNGIRAITNITKNNIAVGTRYNGLFVLTEIKNSVWKIQHFGVNNGLNSNNVWDLAVDNRNKCWIATSAGINSLEWKNKKWQLVNESKGRTTKSLGAILVDKNQKVWTNAFPGIIAIDSKPTIDTNTFITKISKVIVNGKVISNKKEQNFNYKQNNINIYFATNTYNYENEVEYYWQLFKNGQWSAPTQMHHVNFSALEPGTYQFKVKAKDIYGNWSIRNDIYPFIISSPFWKQNWFIVLVSIIFISIIYAIFRYRITQIKKLEKLRLHLAQELHDDIGSGLTSISILSNISRKSLTNKNNKINELLGEVVEQSNKIQQNMSEIVWAIKPDNDKMNNLVTFMRTYLAKTLEPQNIVIQFDIDETMLQKKMQMQDRRDFFLIFKEAVNNIAKHAKAKKVQITLQILENRIVMQICDDGIGFDITHNQVGNGIQNIRMRTQRLKGTLTIKNDLNKGCCLEISIPYLDK